MYKDIYSESDYIKRCLETSKKIKTNFNHFNFLKIKTNF